MADIAMLHLSAIKCKCDPKCNCLDYHTHFSEDVNELREHLEEGKRRKRDIKVRVKEEVGDQRMLKLEVEGWLKRAEEINGKVQALLEKVQTVEWYSRECLGKHVRRRTNEVKQIYEKGEFTGDIAIDKPENPTYLLSIPVTSNLQIDLIKKHNSYLK